MGKLSIILVLALTAHCATSGGHPGYNQAYAPQAGQGWGQQSAHQPVFSYQRNTNAQIYRQPAVQQTYSHPPVRQQQVYRQPVVQQSYSHPAVNQQVYRQPVVQQSYSHPAVSQQVYRQPVVQRSYGHPAVQQTYAQGWGSPQASVGYSKQVNYQVGGGSGRARQTGQNIGRAIGGVVAAKAGLVSGVARATGNFVRQLVQAKANFARQVGRSLSSAFNSGGSRSYGHQPSGHHGGGWGWGR